VRIWNTHADVIGRMSGCPWPSIFMMSYAHLIHDMANDRLISGSSTATLPPHAPSYRIPYLHKGPSPVVMSANLERNTHHLDTHVFERKFLETEMDLYSGEYVDPVYQAKSRTINHSIQDIGMGKYQAGVTHTEMIAIACSRSSYGSGVSSQRQVLDGLRRFSFSRNSNIN